MVAEGLCRINYFAKQKTWFILVLQLGLLILDLGIPANLVTWKGARQTPKGPGTGLVCSKGYQAKDQSNLQQIGQRWGTRPLKQHKQSSVSWYAEIIIPLMNQAYNALHLTQRFNFISQIKVLLTLVCQHFNINVAYKPIQMKIL